MIPIQQMAVAGTALLVIFIVIIVAVGAVGGFYMGRRQ